MKTISKTTQKSTNRFIVGIDEVGRGPIAGPVAVGAFRISALALAQLKKSRALVGLKDSKKLSRAQRELWFMQIQKWQAQHLCGYAISFVSAAEIDRKGIAPAIRKALARSLIKVGAQALPQASEQILLDGGLKAPAHFVLQKTIIKGDEKEAVISLASIAAKVTRDRRMTMLARRYPDYGFEVHAGYGTAGHYMALKKKGFSVEHRKSFLKRFRP